MVSSEQSSDFKDLGQVDLLRGTEGFVPISLNSVRVDSITNFDLYIQLAPDKPHVLYSERNIPFTEEARRRLIDNNVGQVFISANQRREYGRYVEKHLSEILNDEKTPTPEKAEILYGSAYGVVEDMLANPQEDGSLVRTKEIVHHAVESMFADKIRLGHLLKVVSFDYYIYTHSVNVTAYAVALAQRVGYRDPATLRELANGALLHDIGKSKIDPAINSCKGKLTEEQWEALKKHPTLGYEMLTKAGNLGEIALDLVLHHHEKLRGGGYPDGLKGDLISPFVRMVTIGDIFDALTTERSFQPARSSFEAFKIMHKENGADLDPHLLRVFVQIMGNPDASR